jgi:hypothetical protein
MLYQPTLSKSGELIDEAIQNSSWDNRHVLVIAGITASIFHLVFLGYWPIMISQPSMIQVQDVNEYTTILRTNGFGKSWCV